MEYLTIANCLIILSLILLVIMFLYARKLNRELKNLKAIRESDIVETNKLVIENSENNLKLFFQFETVLEELVKMMRKSERHHTEIIDNQKEIRLLIEYQIKKQ